MIILQIVPSLARKGPVNVAIDLIKAFTKYGHRCLLMYLDETGDTDGIECELYNIKDIDLIPWEFVDVVHAHGYRPIKLLKSIKTNWPKIKRVCTLHNYVYDDFKYEYGRIRGYIASKLFLRSLVKAKAIMVALSKDASNYYQKKLNKTNIPYAYNCRVLAKYPLEADDVEMLMKFKGDGHLLGTISVLNKRKNLGAAIKALKMLPEDYKLCIVGDGPESKNLHQLAAALGVANRVLFTGTRKDAYRFLEYFDIFLLPSKSEGFPLSIIEAAAYGIRIVSSPLPMLQELFTDGENIVFADVDNNQNFCDGILRAHSISALKSAEIYSKFFTIDYLYNQYYSIYTSND